MTDNRLHPLAAEYLARLRRSARHLPGERQRELVSEIEAHLTQVAPVNAGEEDVLGALERLGPPGDIVEAEQPAAAAPADRRGIREWGAVILLPLGGFAFGIGWLIGLILLWSSRLWTTRDKLIGTLIIPGGLLTALIAAEGAAAATTAGSCTGFGTPVSPTTGRPIGHGTMHCTTTGGAGTAATILQVVLAVILVLGPIASAIYLARRARSAPQRLVAAGG